MVKKVILVVMLCVFQIGLSLLLFPVWNRLFTEKEVTRSAEQFLSEAAAPISEPETESTNPTEPQRPYAELWEEMRAYNDNLYAQKQADLNSTDDFKESSFQLRDYGRKDEVFAVLTIPKINLDMPVYLGATDLNLASGAAHLSQTSLPIGGENTNCVIAGHRGWNGALYFRYVPDLVKGDIVTIRNIWETLTYQVVETKIIAPNDVDAIRIQEGRELLTLLTCHPYASGGKQRYLVICERVYQEKVSGARKDRPELNRMLDALREGDVVVITELSRLGRTVKGLIELVEKIHQAGADIKSLKENIDTTSPMGKMVFTVMAAVAEMERDLLRERTAEGLKAARARGRHGGRPAIDQEKLNLAMRMYDSKNCTVAEITKATGVSKATLYQYLSKRKK